MAQSDTKGMLLDNDEGISSVTSEEATDSPSSTESFVKDSKYAWVVCLAGFLNQVLILGVLHVFGVFFVEFVKEFNATRGHVAWVGSVAYGLSMTCGPITSFLISRFGNRVVMMTGSVICSVAVLSTSFVTDLNVMFGSFSVLYGLGASFAVTPTMTIAPTYFRKYVSIAVGFMVAGSSTGTLILAPTAQALVKSIGWRNTFRVFSGTCLFTVFCGALIRPASKRQTTPLEKMKMSPIRNVMADLKLWKDRVFILWTLAVFLVMFGYYIPYVHLVSYAEGLGISNERGSVLLMILGGATATGRICFGKIVQYGFINRLNMHQVSMIITGAGTMMLSLITSFGGLVVYVICIGLVDGCYVVLLPLLTATLVGEDKAVLAWGFLVGACSITFTIGPPVAGLLYDYYGSYDIAFHIAGIPIIAGSLCLFLIPWAQRTSRTANVMKIVSEINTAIQATLDPTNEDQAGLPIPARTGRTSHTTLCQSVEDSYIALPSSVRTTYEERSSDVDLTIMPGDANRALVSFHPNTDLIQITMPRVATSPPVGFINSPPVCMMGVGLDFSSPRTQNDVMQPDEEMITISLSNRPASTNDGQNPFLNIQTFAERQLEALTRGRSRNTSERTSTSTQDSNFPSIANSGENQQTSTTEAGHAHVVTTPKAGLSDTTQGRDRFAVERVDSAKKRSYERIRTVSERESTNNRTSVSRGRQRTVSENIDGTTSSTVQDPSNNSFIMVGDDSFPNHIPWSIDPNNPQDSQAGASHSAPLQPERVHSPGSDRLEPRQGSNTSTQDPERDIAIRMSDERVVSPSNSSPVDIMDVFENLFMDSDTENEKPQ